MMDSSLKEGSPTKPQIQCSNEQIDISHIKVPKSILLQIFQYFDKETLRAASEVSKTFNELSKHPALWSNTYSGPHSQLPELQKAIPFPPPAVLQTTLPAHTTVIPAPQYSTILPQSTKILLPVLPETVPLIAQVPDVVSTLPQHNAKDNEKEIVEISQVLPGYARSYAGDYVPNEVNHHSFSTFANTISFNVSRYPTPATATNSKDYNVSSSEAAGGSKAAEDAVKKLDIATSDTPVDQIIQGLENGNIEYKPAEYFRGVPTAHVVQSMVVSKAITNVKPEVLASGRILTHMTPIPSTLTVTMSTTSETITSSKEASQGASEASNGVAEVKGDNA